MAEIYKKQYTTLERVLGKYGFGTSKVVFATKFRRQVHLASGKMSKGAEPKFLYKMGLSMSESELLSLIEALEKCRKGNANYHEFGEYTDFKGQVNRLVLKTSDYEGLVALKLQRVSIPDEFALDDPLESCDPDPTPEIFADATAVTDTVGVDWNECFEKFYISKNEDWKEMARKLRNFSDELEGIWSDNASPTVPPSTPVQIPPTVFDDGIVQPIINPTTLTGPVPLATTLKSVPVSKRKAAADKTDKKHKKPKKAKPPPPPPPTVEVVSEASSESGGEVEVSKNVGKFFGKLGHRRFLSLQLF